MNDGTIDSLRLMIINQLKADLQEELKNTTIKMRNRVKFLTPLDKQTKIELFDTLWQELESRLMYAETTFNFICWALEKASKSVWELILNSDGLGKDISETVERVFCRLSGREPPLFPLPIVENQPCKETEKGKEKGEREGA